jgi:hypothetical protein
MLLRGAAALSVCSSEKLFLPPVPRAPRASGVLDCAV